MRIIASTLDRPGKDTWRHREAGASEVLLATSRRYILMHELRNEAEPPLADLVARLTPVDLVIVEGFKGTHLPKIEVHRAERGTDLIARSDPDVVAVASDVPSPTSPSRSSRWMTFQQ